jgi:O-antigen/teichoic acid export membrane protein
VRKRLLIGVMAQGVASISNLVVALFVARGLGAIEFGRFSLIFAILAVATAIQSAWVGDALVVLGPRVESAARWWQLVLTVASIVLSGGVLALTQQFSRAEIALYVPLCAFWLYEEFGRQWFIAHQRFVAQGMNDLIYLIVAVATLSTCQAVGELSLSTVLASMAIAAAIAWVGGQSVVPAEFRSWRRPVTDGHRDAVRRYGSWRAAQAASGALSTVATRTLVVDGMGLRTLGNLELGRTVVGPLLAVLAGLGNVLLPVASANSRAGERKNFRVVTLVVTASVAVYGAAVVLWAPFFVGLFGGAGFEVSRTVLAGWVTVAFIISLTQSVSVRALVDLPSRLVFNLRSLGTVATLLLVGAASYSRIPELVPFSVAFGTLLSGALLQAAMRRGAAGSPSGS